MQTSHVRGPGPLLRALLAALTFTLPTACGIEDVIIDPGNPDDPTDPGNPDDPTDPDNPDDPTDPDNPDDPTDPEPENPQAIYYDVYTFATEIQPIIDVTGCAVAGCHDVTTTAAGSLGLFANPAPGSDEMWSNLQALTSYVQLDARPFSAEDTMLFVRASDTHRGVMFPDLTLLLSWIEDAALRFGPDEDRFDAALFASAIQPLLDNLGCSALGCHNIDDAAGSFGLFTRPGLVSPEMNANLQAVTSRIDLRLQRAEETAFYVRATDRHRGISFEEDEVLLAWIQAALDADNPQ